MASVRARRPPSPPPLPGYTPQPRFPPKSEHYLDADARRDAARTGAAPLSRRPRAYPGGLAITPGEWKLMVLILLLAAFVRLFRISQPNSVVFDEVHFGKFAARYIKTRYFVDVHPPLAKLLITAAAWIFGFEGHFDFGDIAVPYENVPYVAMRLVPAMLGISTVPLAYFTLRMLDCRATTALLASLLLIFENALITQSRHILLDSPLVFFTALTVFFWVGFCNEQRYRPFTNGWWTWLTLTGLSLGAVVSCKWVGLFTIATVGFGTILQLWTLLGDTRVSAKLWTKHFLARGICLIIVPTLFYMFMFQIHFLILENSGEGDGFMSAEFQHTLGGHSMADTYADVAVGSTITLRHVNTQGGYLHSHPHNYPGGSKQQQITLYPHIDENNEWRIVNASAPGDPYENWRDLDGLQMIKDGARVKLRHIITDKSLHSHDFRPPVSEVDFQNEVSAYGLPGFEGDMNDDWIIEIDHGDSSDWESGKGGRVKTLRSVFKLKHPLTGCYLFSHVVKLPQWGFDQQEVTCNKNAIRKNSLWMVETSTHPNLPKNAAKVNYRRPSFLSKFLELNTVMWNTNAGLTERHNWDSRPSSWPRLLRGINFWVKDHKQIYLVGNPFIWWLSTASVLSYAGVRGFLILRAKRGYHDFENSKVLKYDALCGFLFTGWALHYFPFFLMSRQLFLHHYLPALYFAILLLCSVFDLLTSLLKPQYRLGVAAVIVLVAVWNYAIFRPLVYGLPWTKGQCRNAQWLRSWDFDCNAFFDDIASYDALAAIGATPKAAAPLATIGGGDDARGPVVVEDPYAPILDEAPPPEETQVDVHQAQPGRDAFAAPEKAPPMPPGGVVEDDKVDDDAEKVVVPVDVVGAQGDAVVEEALKEKVEEKETQKDVPVPKAEEEEWEKKVDEGIAHGVAEHERFQDEVEGKTPAPDVKAEEGAKKEASGPKGEEELHADEVREELFPGEAKA